MRRPAAVLVLIASLLSIQFDNPVLAGQLNDASAALIRRDFDGAYQLFKPLAEQGDPKAQCVLGLLYAEGKGATQDYAEAVKWYRKAADQGDAYAQCNLGVMYTEGKGVSQDFVLGYMWLDLAASRFPASEAEKGAQTETKRDSVASKMTRSQIAEARRMAREWKAKNEK